MFWTRDCRLQRTYAIRLSFLALVGAAIGFITYPPEAAATCTYDGNIVYGTNNPDECDGDVSGPSQDTMYAYNQDDLFRGGSDYDVLHLDNGADKGYGGAIADVIKGGWGADELHDEVAYDTDWACGGDDNDRAELGDNDGYDTFYGGNGTDSWISNDSGDVLDQDGSCPA